MSSAGSERERFVLVLFYGMLRPAGYLDLLVVAPFLAPIGWAAVFAMVLDPVQGRLARRTGRPRAAAATTVLAAFTIVVPTITVTTDDREHERGSLLAFRSAGSLNPHYRAARRRMASEPGRPGRRYRTPLNVFASA